MFDRSCRYSQRIRPGRKVQAEREASDGGGRATVHPARRLPPRRAPGPLRNDSGGGQLFAAACGRRINADTLPRKQTKAREIPLRAVVSGF